MLKMALLFFVVGVIAALLGFAGIDVLLGICFAISFVLTAKE